MTDKKCKRHFCAVPQNTAQMPVVQHDHMVECVAPNTADDPLHIRILPWRSRGYVDFFDALDQLKGILPVQPQARKPDPK